MDADTQTMFPPTEETLKDGRTVTIRPLQRADGKRLGRFYANLPRQASRYYWPHPLEYEYGPRNAAKADSPLEVVLLLGTPEGEIGGEAWYRWKDRNARSSSFGICIAEAYQGYGAGKALLKRLLAIADAGVGPRRMALTCQHANSGAVALYQKMGFRIVKEGTVGARRGFPEEPQYWMERVCGP